MGFSGDHRVRYGKGGEGWAMVRDGGSRRGFDSGDGEWHEDRG